MPSEFLQHLWREYFAAVTSKGQLLLLATLPAYLVLAVLWEYVHLHRGERSLGTAVRKAFPAEDFRAVTFRTDVFCTFVAHLVKRPLLGMFLRLYTAAIAAQLGFAILNETFGRADVQMNWAAGIVLLHFLAFYLSDEFSIYVNHYLEHKVPLLWATHRLHHSAEAMTPLTAASREAILPLPTDYIAIYAIDFTIKAAVLGTVLYWTAPAIHPVALVLMGYVMVYVTLFEWFAHSRSRISFGWFDRVFVSPVLHQLHHSAERHQRDKNFGRTLSLFDWMFGTLYIPAKDETWRLGLDPSELGSANPHVRIRDYLFEPWRYAWNSLRRRPSSDPQAAAQGAKAVA